MITIREAVIKDIEGLANLLEQLVVAKSQPEKMKHMIEQIQNDGSYILLVAEYEGKIVGTIMGIVCYDLTGECKSFMVVENVIIDKDRRGCGIGKLLINRLEEKATEHEVNYIILVSTASKIGAHAFYETMGYANDPVKGFRKYL